MAMAYVTSRGKNKKAKLGVRKDANNNAANKLNVKIAGDVINLDAFTAHETPAMKSLGTGAMKRRQEALESARLKLGLLKGPEAQPANEASAAPAVAPAVTASPDVAAAMLAALSMSSAGAKAQPEADATIESSKPVDLLHCGREGCDASGKMLLCSRCQKISFCSAQCQRTAWPRHKLVCGPAPAASPAATTATSG